jgi:hypothetical protein
LLTIEDSLTILFEENVICITQLRGGYVKRDKTDYISPKLFYINELLQKEKKELI